MRVTMLSKALVIGAYQRKCELIASSGDIDLTVLTPPAWRTGQHIDTLEHAHTAGYQLRAIPIRRNGNFHLHYYPTFGRELARTKPEILHLDEEPYNTATFLALRAARAVGAKTVFFSWQNLLRRYPQPFRWMERYVLAHADAAIAGNREAVRVLRAKGYQREIHIIPQFGVDEHLFCPQPKPAGEKRQFVIGYAGRLVPEKGVDVLLQALANLPEVVRLIIVGAGDELPNLRALATRLNVAERVQFTPAVPADQMPALYAQFDALVVPSRTRPNWKEQFGRVLIEAMACGVPVVGSTCGEIPNVIGDAGLVFDENQVEDLTRKLIVLLTEPARCHDLAQRGRARVLAQYTMSRIAAETVEVYRSLRPLPLAEGPLQRGQGAGAGEG